MSNRAKEKGDRWERAFARLVTALTGRKASRISWTMGGATTGNVPDVRVSGLDKDFSFECKSYKSYPSSLLDSDMVLLEKKTALSGRKYTFLALDLTNKGRYAIMRVEDAIEAINDAQKWRDIGKPAPSDVVVPGETTA